MNERRRYADMAELAGRLSRDEKKNSERCRRHVCVSIWTQGADGKSGAAAHLSSEVTDALTCLQDGYLHVLCGFFGMARLLLQQDKEEEKKEHKAHTQNATLLSERVQKKINSRV